MRSINLRLLFATSLVLVFFLGATGYMMDRVYKQSVEDSLKARLEHRVSTLIAATEPDENGIIHLTNPISESRFFTPGSGLYARIIRNASDYVWESPSMQGVSIVFSKAISRGSRHFEIIQMADNSLLFAFSLGVTWGENTAPDNLYTFAVAEDLNSIYGQIKSFRKILWGWLGAVVIVLLVVQASILRWGLKPLRRVAGDLTAIKAGKRTQLEGKYPIELHGLTNNLNALIRSERRHMERYRNTMADLAHSLKTPLALLRGAVEAKESEHELRDTVQEQIDRMSQIIEYQLQRAVTSGSMALAAPVPVFRVTNQIIDAMNKVYADKGVQCSLHMMEDINFYGDESDLMEVVGNLVDNAYKYCGSRIIISVVQYTHDDDCDGVIMTVEDDGPGISEDMAHQVLQRGVRGDEQSDGHGIGLAIVKDIVRSYGGSLEIRRGELGGARMTVQFP